MPLEYKVDVLKALKEKGYTTYKIRKDKVFSESTVRKFRHNIGVSWENIERLCEVLECQPSDILIFRR